MNYRRTPNERPRSKSLCRGDLLTDEQSMCIESHILSYNGLMLCRDGSRGWKVITVDEFRRYY